MGTGLIRPLVTTRVHTKRPGLPPYHHLAIKDGTLQLINRFDGINHELDIFMESLALNENKRKGIAVILSGEGRDGIKGAAAIKNAAGPGKL